MKKSRRIIGLLLFLVIITTSVTSQAKSVVKISGKTLQNGFMFTFNNMPYNGINSPIKAYKGDSLTLHTVQNFAFSPDGKYVFSTSECESSKGTHTLLCRSDRPKEGTDGVVSEYQQAHVLFKYGHGEAVDVTQPDTDNETYYIWVSCSPNSEGYGTEIARITYVVDENGNGEIISTVKIKNFNMANVSNGKATTFSDPNGQRKVKRTGVAIDEDNNLIMFRLKFQDGSGTNYVAYDYEKLSSALDKLDDGKKYNIANAAKLQKANVKSFLMPFDTYQSFYVQGNNIYVAGGNCGVGAAIYVIPFSLQKNGKALEQNKNATNSIGKTISIKPSVKINGKRYDISSMELEGIKVKKIGKKRVLYLSFHPSGASIRDSVPVYRIKI